MRDHHEGRLGAGVVGQPAERGGVLRVDLLVLVGLALHRLVGERVRGEEAVQQPRVQHDHGQQEQVGLPAGNQLQVVH